MTNPELTAEAILALMQNIDIKYFNECGIEEKFWDYMKIIEKEIQSTYKWTGLDKK